VARVLHTPGHTPGSISLVVELETPADDHVGSGLRRSTNSGDTPRAARSVSRLLAGDTLFRGSIGRTDLPGGSSPQIIRSIREKLLVLPEDMIVYPGHGDLTTIGFEREHNPFLE
jgi:glyoxylase-like metal-dependent hydrolase (beta-lactamase superfamily II)